MILDNNCDHEFDAFLRRISLALQFLQREVSRTDGCCLKSSQISDIYEYLQE